MRSKVLAFMIVSAVFSFGAVHAAIVDPATVSGMKLRLDANAIIAIDGQPVALWSDTSGNGNNATQATAGQQPLFKTNIMNGKPVVRFDGLDDRMLEPLALSGAQTWFAVYKQNDPSGNQTAIALRDGGQFSQLSFLNLGGYQNITFKVWAASGSTAVGFSPTLDTSGHILAFTYNNGDPSTPSSYPSLSYNQTSQTVLGSGVTGQDQPVGLIGAQNNAVINFFNGDLAEIIIYDSVLSPSNYSGIQEYLYDKWFVTVPEPSTVLLLGMGGLLVLRKRRLK